MTGIEVRSTDPDCRRSAGRANAEVKAAAAQSALWYPPDPSSVEICSIAATLRRTLVACVA